MALEVVHGPSGNIEAAHELADLLDRELDEGTIYLGYPVLATADDRVEIDALLVSEERGLIAFRFAGAIPTTDDDWMRLGTEQDRGSGVDRGHHRPAYRVVAALFRC